MKTQFSQLKESSKTFMRNDETLACGQSKNTITLPGLKNYINSFKNIRLCSSSTDFAINGETFMHTFTPITQTTVTSTENFMNNLSTYSTSSLEKSAMPRRGVPFG